MEILTISLPSDHQRRARLEASLAPYGLRYHWLEAVDARAWDEAEINKHCDQKQLIANMSYHPKPGAIGCHLSHIQAFRHLLASDQNAMIILEDDAQITAEFVAHLPCLEKATEAFDIIFLCDRRANRPSRLIGQSDKGLGFTFKRFANIGTNGYVITRKAADYMVSHHAKFGIEIDMRLNQWWQSGLHIVTTDRDLVTHDDMGSSIGYDHRQPVKHPLRRIMHALTRARFSYAKRTGYDSHLSKMKSAFEKACKI